jgi:DHA3 family macrolide efflux protein-like MFS transporter
VWGGFKRRIVTSLTGVIGMGVGALLVGLSPATAFWMALGAIVVTGLMNPVANGPLHAIFQSAVAPEMQGRVFSVIGSACSAMAPLGMAIAGPVADVLGVQSWFVLAGAACIVMAVWGLLNPAVMNIEDNGQASSSARKKALASAAVPTSVSGE